MINSTGIYVIIKIITIVVNIRIFDVYFMLLFIRRSFVVIMKTSSGWVHINQAMAPPLCTIVPTMDGGALTLTPLQGEAMRVQTEQVLQKTRDRFKWELLALTF